MVGETRRTVRSTYFEDKELRDKIFWLRISAALSFFAVLACVVYGAYAYLMVHSNDAVASYYTRVLPYVGGVGALALIAFMGLILVLVIILLDRSGLK